MPRKGNLPDMNSGGSSGSMWGIGWFVSFVVVIGVLLFAGIFLALDALPADTINTEKKDWYELVQTTIVILGVLAGSVAAAISYRSQRIKEKELRVQEDGRFTDRFTSAIEQLGNNDSIAVRIGGIYALDRLAYDSPRDHQRIADVLASHVREQNHTMPEYNPRVIADTSHKMLHDVSVVINVLVRLRDRYRNVDLNLRGAMLARARLQGAHLEGVYLGDVYMAWSNLVGAHLNGATLSNATLNVSSLNDALLLGARLTLTKLIRADLTGAHLNNAILHCARLEHANLNSADFRGADLTNAHLTDTSMEGTDLRGANLTGATYGTNILKAIWDENTIFANGQKGTPDVEPDTPTDK